MADNLVLGRGKLFFTPYAPGATVAVAGSGSAPSPLRGYFGNTPELSMAVNNTKLDHYSAEGGLKVKDRSVLLQTDATITFSTDNISVPNLMLWFGGKHAGSTPADAPDGIGTLSLIGSAHQIFGALEFLSDNAVGENSNYWFPYVNLAPNGTFALKGDAWQTLSFTAEALKRDAATERFYAFTPTAGANTSDAAADTTALLTAVQAAYGSGGAAPT
jgi:hypothetical protein